MPMPMLSTVEKGTCCWHDDYNVQAIGMLISPKHAFFVDCEGELVSAAEIGMKAQREPS